MDAGPGPTDADRQPARHSEPDPGPSDVPPDDKAVTQPSEGGDLTPEAGHEVAPDTGALVAPTAGSPDEPEPRPWHRPMPGWVAPAGAALRPVVQTLRIR